MPHQTQSGMETSKRGLPTYRSQPSFDELEVLTSFSYKAANGLRITFNKRQRAGRKPTWNGVVHRKGKSFCAYAGTSETFEIGKVEERLSALVAP